MRPSAELTAFSKRLGYDFQKPELLIQAMTHSSLSSTTRGDNQRLGLAEPKGSKHCIGIRASMVAVKCPEINDNL